MGDLGLVNTVLSTGIAYEQINYSCLLQVQGTGSWFLGLVFLLIERGKGIFKEGQIKIVEYHFL